MTEFPFYIGSYSIASPWAGAPGAHGAGITRAAIDADSDVAAWPATLDRILAIGGPEAIYVPGHGKVVDAEFIRCQREWLKARAGVEPR